MVASAMLANATVALSGNDLGLIGSIIGGVSTIVAAVMSNAAASRRQRRELRYQHKSSGMTGFLFALLLISIAAGLYFANRPQHEGTARASEPSRCQPQRNRSPSKRHRRLSQSISRRSMPKRQWIKPGTCSPMATRRRSPRTQTGETGSGTFGGPSIPSRQWEKCRSLNRSTAARIVVELPVKFNMIPELIAPGKAACSTENDDFTIVRIDGALQIDKAQISPGSYRTC